MPKYEVRRTQPVLTISVVDAPNPKLAQDMARQLWLQDAMIAAEFATVTRQPFAPDDTEDARSDRSEWGEADVADDAAEAFRWGFTPDGREPEDCGREQ